MTRKEIYHRYYLKHREEIAARCRKWRENNKERMRKWHREYSQSDRGLAVRKRYYESGKWRAKLKKYQGTDKGRAQRRRRNLKKTSGLTEDEFRALLSSQNGKCAICGTQNPRGKGAFHVDHDHATGQVRGLLCHSCNVGLGHFCDNTNTLELAIAYLRRSEVFRTRD